MYKAPFPYFGGKSTVADEVWQRIGADVTNYVEPFFGSGAVLLNRPDWTPDAMYTETVNDKSGFLSNFWRAVKEDPTKVAYYADNPVNENDLHARHAWLVQQADELSAHLEGDPDYYDAKIAGWWLWGACCWIGSGWCSGNGPWQRVKLASGWQLVHLGNKGRGVNRQRVHLGNKGQGVNRKLVHLGDKGQGVNRQRVHLGDKGRGVDGIGENGLYAWMEALGERLRMVRVCCGDWSRVVGPSPTIKIGITGVFLDPPYTADANRVDGLYEQDCLSVGHDVAAWCKANEYNPMLRIALCGYAGEYDLPGWTCLEWKARGGFGSQGNGQGRENANKERIWFSPHCLRTDELDDLPLFATT